MSVNREIELKGTIQSEHLDRVKDLPAIKKRTVGRAKSRKLVTVYFDTPDHALRRLGLSLRVRKVGRAYVQCVKQAHKKLGGHPGADGVGGSGPEPGPRHSGYRG